MRNKVTVVFSCDDNYAKYLAVTISSLVSNFNRDEELEIIIFDAGISSESKEKIIKLSNEHVSIRFVYVDESIFNSYPKTIEHISLATYFRLKLPSLLPGYNKVLYLDVDTLIAKDIFDMWEINMDGYSIAAVIEPEISLNGKNYLKMIGINDSDYFYFNAGVLIINLTYLRESGFEERVPGYIEKYGSIIHYQDQDILNYLVHGTVKYISPIYNFMPMYKNILSRKKRDSIKHLPYSIEEIEGLQKTVCIYHYCGKRKAWMDTCTHYGFDLYMKHLNNTAWKGDCYESNHKVGLFKSLSYKIKRVRIKLNEIF